MSGATLAVPAVAASGICWRSDARPCAAPTVVAKHAYAGVERAKAAAAGAKAALANATDASMSHLFDTIPARPPDPDP